MKSPSFSRQELCTRRYSQSGTLGSNTDSQYKTSPGTPESGTGLPGFSNSSQIKTPPGTPESGSRIPESVFSSGEGSRKGSVSSTLEGSRKGSVSSTGQGQAVVLESRRRSASSSRS